MADLEVVAKVVVDMVEDEGAAGKSLLECLCEAPSDLVVSSPKPLGTTWLML